MIKGIEKRTQLAFWVSVATVGTITFQWSIVDWITPFLLLPLKLLLYIVFCAGLGFSLSCLLKFKEIRWLTTVPLGVQLIALALIAWVPFTKIWLDAYFYFYKPQRQDVVARIYAGELAPNVHYNSSLISLGFAYPGISMGGNQVVVQNIDGLKYVFFFTFRGLLDNYSGFLYVPDGGNPRTYNDLGEEDTTQIIKYADNWYYTSHH